MLFNDVTNVLLRESINKDVILRQPIACYEIAKKSYDFVMTYLENHTIYMTLVMLLINNTTTNFMGLSYPLAAWSILFAPFHRKDYTFVTPVVEH